MVVKAFNNSLDASPLCTEARRSKDRKSSQNVHFGKVRDGDAACPDTHGSASSWAAYPCDRESSRHRRMQTPDGFLPVVLKTAEEIHKSTVLYQGANLIPEWPMRTTTTTDGGTTIEANHPLRHACAQTNSGSTFCCAGGPLSISSKARKMEARFGTVRQDAPSILA